MAHAYAVLQPCMMQPSKLAHGAFLSSFATKQDAANSIMASGTVALCCMFLHLLLIQTILVRDTFRLHNSVYVVRNVFKEYSNMT